MAPTDLAPGTPNGAAFEWVQHEQVGRDAGLTTARALHVVRETEAPAQQERAANSGVGMCRALGSFEVEDENEGERAGSKKGWRICMWRRRRW